MDWMQIAVSCVAVSTAFCGVVIYVVRAETRSHIAGCEIREAQHDERHHDLKEALKACNDKLDRLLEARR